MRIFLDGASYAEMMTEYECPGIPPVEGYTTNPTLMRQAGVTSYREFAEKVLHSIPDRPVSLEILSEEPEEMVRQGIALAELGTNVLVKVPVISSRGVYAGPVLIRLRLAAVRLNVTAVMSATQVELVLGEVDPEVVSVFAGRIGDAGRRQEDEMLRCMMLTERTETELLWASTRSAADVARAEQCECDIITVSPRILRTLRDTRDLTPDQQSAITAGQFARDAAGYSI